GVQAVLEPGPDAPVGMLPALEAVVADVPPDAHAVVDDVHLVRFIGAASLRRNSALGQPSVDLERYSGTHSAQEQVAQQCADDDRGDGHEQIESEEREQYEAHGDDDAEAGERIEPEGAH